MSATISAHDVTHDLIPKLKATQRLVDSTLTGRLDRCQSPSDRARLEELKAEFELEITMIRMNLEHLLTRYATQLDTARQGSPEGNSASLALDPHERVAIENARALYRRARELAS